MRSSMLEVQKRDNVEDQDHEESHNERDATKPREHEGAVAGTRRRRGNADNVVKSSESLCKEFDHGSSRSLERVTQIILGASTQLLHSSPSPPLSPPQFGTDFL